MPTLTKQCTSLSLVNEGHNKEYSLAKFKQFSKCSFGEISLGIDELFLRNG